jgi:hypothetical protein
MHQKAFTLDREPLLYCKHSAISYQPSAISYKLFQANAKNTYLIINQFVKHSDS